MLAFGKTTDRLTSSEQNALSNQAQKFAGSMAAGWLEQNVGQALGLDTIEVEADDKLGTGRVSVGRYVTQDLFLSYGRQFTEEGGNTVEAEYSLSRHLKLKGSSDVGATALDLLWRLEY